MWIVLNKSFLSIVKNRNNENELLVRARVKGDIEKVFENDKFTIENTERLIHSHGQETFKDIYKVLYKSIDRLVDLVFYPESEEDVKKICLLKRRKLDKGLILVSGNFSHFDAYLSHLSEDLIYKTKSKWPGAHTWLVPANDNVPSWIKGDSDFVALRQSVHPSIIELSKKLNSVITSTSANISSEPPAKNAEEVRNLFGDEVSILEGELGGADKPTPIQNLITDEWIRN